MRARVLRALLEAVVVVWRRCCACRGTVEVEIINRSPAQTPARCSTSQRAGSTAEGGRQT